MTRQLTQLTIPPRPPKKQRNAEALPPIIMEGLDGLLKTFVDYATETAFSPQPFLALGAALCAVGAAAGRRYASPTNLRTNLMVLALADSGGGKERPRDCLASALMKADMGQYLGGSKIGSSAGLLTAIKDNPVVLFALDEVGHMLGINASKNAGTHKSEIMPLLTELFTRANSTFLGTNYGDSKINQKVKLEQPHVCLYGVTVPGTLWRAFGSGAMQDGSLARFLVFQTPEDYPDTQQPAKLPMPEVLTEGLRRIAGLNPSGSGNLAKFMPAIMPHMSSDTTHDAQVVPYDDDAERLIEVLSDDRLTSLRQRRGTVQTPFWARFAEHTIRLAMIKAISRDPANPVMTGLDIEWARALAKHCIQTVLSKAEDHVADSPFEAGVKKIAAFIRDAKEPVTASQIQRVTQAIDPKNRNIMLADLINSGDVVEKVIPPQLGSRKATRTYHWAGSPL